MYFDLKKLDRTANKKKLKQAPIKDKSSIATNTVKMHVEEKKS